MYTAFAFKEGLTYEEFLDTTPYLLELKQQASLKNEEQRINNNIIVGAKSAIKLLQFYSGKRDANKLDLVDYKLHLFDDEEENERIRQIKLLWDVAVDRGITEQALDIVRKRLEKAEEEMNNAGSEEHGEQQHID